MTKLERGINDLQTTNPELAKEWNYEKNGDLKPSDVLPGSHKKVWWKCQKGHEWEAAVYSRKDGNGCPFCSNHKVLAGYNDLLTTHPFLASQWDYKKNSITPKEIVSGSCKPVWWICPICLYSYKSSPNKRISGDNCPYCSGKKVKVGYNDLETWCRNNNRFDLIQEFDTKKNEFTMTEITPGSGKKVWWICPIGHSYQATLNHRINRGSGCGICSHKVFREGENDLLTTNPEIAQEWDYEKNPENPTEVMAGSNKKKYWFICPKGHSYCSTLLNKKNGATCPVCNMERHTSFPEKAICYYMKKYFSNVVENYHSRFLGRKEIDIYLADQKVGIEYDGRAWHKHKQKDLNKDKVCEENGILLFRIREYGCIEYESTSIKKCVTPHNMQELNEAILFVISELNKTFSLSIEADVDIDRDRISILDTMNLSEKDKSLAEYCPIIVQYWDYDKNGKTTPKMISYGSGKTIYLRCELGHKWKDIAKEFPKHPGCPYCNGQRVTSGRNDLFTDNPELTTLWSPNNIVDPKTIKSGSNIKVLWYCPDCGGEYEMMVKDKTSGKGCPYCSGRRVLKGFNDLATLFPELVKEWNYDKNAPLKPDGVTKGSNKIVWWFCKRGHEWEASIAKRVLGQGCPICSGRRVLAGFNDLETHDPNLAKQWHPKRNNDLLPNMVSPGSEKKVWWTCQMGHEWQATVNSRVRGNGCPFCKKTRGKK